MSTQSNDPATDIGTEPTPGLTPATLESRPPRRLDTRAYRLARPAGTTVFDIDRPEVLEFDDQVPAAYGLKPRADRRTMPMDLRSDRAAAQAAAGADAIVATA